MFSWIKKVAGKAKDLGKKVIAVATVAVSVAKVGLHYTSKLMGYSLLWVASRTGAINQSVKPIAEPKLKPVADPKSKLVDEPELNPQSEQLPSEPPLRSEQDGMIFNYRFPDTPVERPSAASQPVRHDRNRIFNTHYQDNLIRHRSFLFNTRSDHPDTTPVPDSEAVLRRRMSTIFASSSDGVMLESRNNAPEVLDGTLKIN